MNIKEICHYNTNNPRNKQLRITYGLEEDECLAHLHDRRILPCRVNTEADLPWCPDFKEDKDPKFEKKPAV